MPTQNRHPIAPFNLDPSLGDNVYTAKLMGATLATEDASWIPAVPGPIVPTGYRRMAERLSSDVPPDLRLTVVETFSPGDAALWNEIKADFDSCALAVIARLSSTGDYDWARAESDELASTTRLSGALLGTASKPTTKSANVTPSFPWKDASREWRKRDVAWVKANATSLDVQSLFNKDASTNVGAPFFSSTPWMHVFSTSMVAQSLAEARSRHGRTRKAGLMAMDRYLELVRAMGEKIDPDFWEHESTPKGAFKVGFVRVKTNDKPAAGYRWTGSGLVPDRLYLNASTSRPVRARTSGMNDISRAASRVRLKAMKATSPGMDHHDLSEIGDKTNGYKAEIDAKNFDAHVSREEQLDEVASVFEISKLIGYDDAAAEFNALAYESSVSEKTMIPSARLLGAVDFVEDDGLSSGTTDTSRIGNTFSRNVITAAVAEEHNMSISDACDYVSSGAAEAFWYGDDQVFKHRSLADAVARVMKSGGAVPKVKDGRTFLRSIDGSLLAIRAMYRSLDNDMPRSPAAWKAGAYMRIIGTRKHPCRDIVHGFIRRTYSRLNAHLVDDPEVGLRELSTDISVQRDAAYSFSAASMLGLSWDDPIVDSYGVACGRIMFEAATGTGSWAKPLAHNVLLDSLEQAINQVSLAAARNLQDSELTITQNTHIESDKESS